MTAITSGRVTIPAWRVMRAAWFRNRMTLTVTLVVFAVAAGWTLYEAQSLRSWLIAHHIQQCVAQVNGISSACASAFAVGQFTSSFHAYYVIFPLLGAPGVLAIFGGVRWLTREYETGSFRYTWTLGVSRFRWLAGTLLPLLAVVTAGAVACGLAYDRLFPAIQWLVCSSLVTSSPSGVPWEWNEFPLTPLTFTAFALAGFGIAACAAALIRRTVPAMAATAAATAAGAYLADTRLRTWLITLRPVTARTEYGSPAGRPPHGSYVLREWLTDHAGHVSVLMTHDAIFLPNGQLGTVLSTGSAASQRAWLAAHHYTHWISYQPHSRLLIFQAAWAGALLAVAIAAFGLAIWRVSASS
jgi:hypothetical protein